MHVKVVAPSTLSQKHSKSLAAVVLIVLEVCLSQVSNARLTNSDGLVSNNSNSSGLVLSKGNKICIII